MYICDLQIVDICSYASPVGVVDDRSVLMGFPVGFNGPKGSKGTIAFKLTPPLHADTTLPSNFFHSGWLSIVVRTRVHFFLYMYLLVSIQVKLSKKSFSITLFIICNMRTVLSLFQGRIIQAGINYEFHSDWHLSYKE